MNQGQGPCRKSHSYDFAINVAANLVATGLLVCISYVLGRAGWFPEHPWSTAYAAFMVILVVAVCAVWYTGHLKSIPAIVRGWAVLGLVILGIAKLVQLNMFSRAWSLVTVDPWLTSTILLLFVILISYIYGIRPSVRVRARSNVTQRKEQLPRHIRLVG